MKTQTKHDDWLREKLQDAEFAAEFLNAAGEDDDIRFRAADLAGEIVQRRDQRRLDAIGLEERVQSNRGFDVGEGDQDAHTTSA